MKKRYYCVIFYIKLVGNSLFLCFVADFWRKTAGRNSNANFFLFLQMWHYKCFQGEWGSVGFVFLSSPTTSEKGESVRIKFFVRRTLLLLCGHSASGEGLPVHMS